MCSTFKPTVRGYKAIALVAFFHWNVVQLIFLRPRHTSISQMNFVTYPQGHPLFSCLSITSVIFQSFASLCTNIPGHEIAVSPVKKINHFDKIQFFLIFNQ